MDAVGVVEDDRFVDRDGIAVQPPSLGKGFIGYPGRGAKQSRGGQVARHGREGGEAGGLARNRNRHREADTETVVDGLVQYPRLLGSGRQLPAQFAPREGAVGALRIEQRGIVAIISAGNENLAPFVEIVMEDKAATRADEPGSMNDREPIEPEFARGPSVWSKISAALRAARTRRWWCRISRLSG